MNCLFTERLRVVNFFSIELLAGESLQRMFLVLYYTPVSKFIHFTLYLVVSNSPSNKTKTFADHSGRAVLRPEMSSPA
jgi:hypothetical protein